MLLKTMPEPMQYWIIRNYELAGPFGGEEVVRLLDFDADSLVCPAGKDGGQMGDWERAGDVPELADTIAQAGN